MATISKSEFALLCQVTKPTVTGWIRAGHLSAPALVGEGRFARIDPELARVQLRDRLDPEARISNGLNTVLGDEPLTAGSIDHLLKRERLKQSEYRTAEMARLAAVAKGDFVDAGQARAEADAKVRAATDGMATMIESILQEVAIGIAAETGGNRRTVLHSMIEGPSGYKEQWRRYYARRNPAAFQAQLEQHYTAECAAEMVSGYAKVG